MRLQTLLSSASLRAASRQPPSSAEGSFEKQHRYCSAAGLWFGYRTEEAGRFVYVLADALTSPHESSAAAVPVPPCIQPADGEVQVALLLEERAKEACLLRIESDSVVVAVTSSASACGPELVELLSRLIGCRPMQLSLGKGWSEGSRMLLLRAGLTTREVHDRLRVALAEEARRGVKAFAGQ